MPQRRKKANVQNSKCKKGNYSPCRKLFPCETNIRISRSMPVPLYSYSKYRQLLTDSRSYSAPRRLTHHRTCLRCCCRGRLARAPWAVTRESSCIRKLLSNTRLPSGLVNVHNPRYHIHFPRVAISFDGTTGEFGSAHGPLWNSMVTNNSWPKYRTESRIGIINRSATRNSVVLRHNYPIFYLMVATRYHSSPTNISCRRHSMEAKNKPGVIVVIPDEIQDGHSSAPRQ